MTMEELDQLCINTHPLPGGRRGREGELRASRPAAGRGADGLRALDALPAPRSRAIRAGGIATASCCPPATARRCCTRCCTCTGYDLSLDELRRFRQWGSRTPGHPESAPHARRRGDAPARSARASPTRSAWRSARRTSPRATTARARDLRPPHLRARQRRRRDGGRAAPRRRRWPATCGSAG